MTILAVINGSAGKDSCLAWLRAFEQLEHEHALDDGDRVRCAVLDATTDFVDARFEPGRLNRRIQGHE